jgi:hypothetical protein
VTRVRPLPYMFVSYFQAVPRVTFEKRADFSLDGFFDRAMKNGLNDDDLINFNPDGFFGIHRRIVFAPARPNWPNPRREGHCVHVEILGGAIDFEPFA